MITTSITIGPFTIPLKLILFTASAAAAHLLLYVFRKKDDGNFKKASDLFFNSIVLFFLGWRLSIILTNWSTFRKAPAALLYLPGGMFNYMAGALLILFSILFFYKRKKYSISELGSWCVLTAGSLLFYFILVSVLITLPVNSRLTGDSLLTSDSQSPENPQKPADVLLEESSSSLEQTHPEGETAQSSDLVLLTVDGEEQILNLTGSPVTIVNLWASWCPPCRAEIPELARFYAAYKNSDVRLITVNMTTTEKSIESALEFIENENAEFPVLLDYKGEAAARFKINSVPSTFVFNSRGEITAQKIGAVDYSWLKKMSKQ